MSLTAREKDYNGNYQEVDITNLVGRGLARGMETRIAKKAEHLAEVMPEVFGEKFAQAMDTINGLMEEAGIPFEKKDCDPRWYAVTISPDPEVFDNDMKHWLWMKKIEECFSKTMIRGAVYTVERTKQGNPHIHAIVKCRGLTYKCRIKRSITATMLNHSGGIQWAKERAAMNIVQVDEITNFRGWLDYMGKTLETESEIEWRNSKGYPLYGEVGISIRNEALRLAGHDLSQNQVRKQMVMSRTHTYNESKTKLTAPTGLSPSGSPSAIEPPVGDTGGSSTQEEELEIEFINDEGDQASV